MNAMARIAAFVALLGVIFGAAALAGAALDPDGASGGGHGGSHTTAAADPRDASPTAGHGDRTRLPTAAAEPAAETLPAGVASSQDGLRLIVQRTRFTADLATTLRFRIVDSAGGTVRAFQTEQARRMHLIVVRRDLRRYQHLHPVQGADGAWSIDLMLPDAGVYRMYADFRIADEQHTLGADLFAPGDFRPLDLPAPDDRAAVDGYEVTLSERGGEREFSVFRDGRAVTDLQPYLGARGHLVVLREGDLAYEHVHPAGSSTRQIAFHAGEGEPGTYRLFLQFRHGDRVHTAAFTRLVEP